MGMPKNAQELGTIVYFFYGKGCAEEWPQRAHLFKLQTKQLFPTIKSPISE